MNCANCSQRNTCQCPPEECPLQRPRCGCLLEGCLGYLIIAFVLFLLILLISSVL